MPKEESSLRRILDAEHLRLVQAQEEVARIGELVFNSGRPGVDIPEIYLEGTHFQRAVWDALCLIPAGETISYRQLAERVGHPNAFRAVGTAVGANPIAYLIPCHRVVRSDGALGGYRWGIALKRAILARECMEAGKFAR